MSPSDPARYSRTAELMAVQRGLESCHPPQARLFDDPLAPIFVSPTWRLALGAARVAPVRWALERLYDRVGGPGPRASAIARTRLIDDLIVDALGDNLAQVVIVGAGFDSRAYRLRELSGRRVFEVDRPDTQTAKRERLARASRAPLPGVAFVPVDLEHEDLVAALLAAGYDSGVTGVVLWEGVTQYLTAGAVDTTLAAIHRLTRTGTTLLVTYVDRRALDPATGAAAFPEAARWIRGVVSRGEPWTFGLDPAEVPDFLAARGFALVSDLSTAEAGERHFPSRGRRERGSALYRVVAARVV